MREASSSLLGFILAQQGEHIDGRIVQRGLHMQAALNDTPIDVLTLLGEDETE